MFFLPVLVNVMNVKAWCVANINLNASYFTSLAEIVDYLVFNIHDPISVFAVFKEIN